MMSWSLFTPHSPPSCPALPFSSLSSSLSSSHYASPHSPPPPSHYSSPYVGTPGMKGEHLVIADALDLL